MPGQSGHRRTRPSAPLLAPWRGGRASGGNAPAWARPSGWWAVVTSVLPFPRSIHGPETIAKVTVEVYEPATALAGTFTHHPTGFACVLPPMTICPRPVAAAVS